MNTSTLISYLQKFPPDTEVDLFWDGNPRGDVSGIVLDNGRCILVGDWSVYRTDYPEDQVIYADCPRPADDPPYRFANMTGFKFEYDPHAPRFTFRLPPNDACLGRTVTFLNDVLVNRYDGGTPPQGKLAGPFRIIPGPTSKPKELWYSFLHFIEGRLCK